MLSLIGKELYQWEIGRSVKFTPKEGESINEIHFANRGDALALVIAVTADDYTAEIPPALLQSGKDVLAWAVVAVDGDINTIARLQLSVRRRARPDNYVYTPTEILRWEALDERLKMVEGIDWNASEGEPGHILNRTHYVEGKGKTEILPETVLTTTDDLFHEPVKLGLVAGEAYTISYNGMEYACVAQAFTEDGITMVTIGDFYTASGGTVGTAATGEPFAIIEFPPELAAAEGLEGMFMLLSIDGATEVTLAIYASGETIHKLDNKFLDLDWLPVANENLLVEEQTITATPYDTGEKFAGSVTLESAVDNLYAGQKVAVYVNGTRYETTVIGDNTDGWQVSVGGTTIWFFGKFITGLFLASGDYTVSVYELVPNKLPAEYLPDDLIDDETVAEAVKAYMAENPVEETDPTVPAWAKAESKPTYTAKEVGALPADTEIPTVPSTLPNPHALTFTGAVSATYDGSGAVSVEIPAAVTDDHINGLIDTKLGVIENGSY